MKLSQPNDNRENIMQLQPTVGVRPCERSQVVRSILFRIGRRAASYKKPNRMAELHT